MNDLLHAQDRVWTASRGRPMHINKASRFALFPAAQDVSSNETPRAARRCSNRAHPLHDGKAEHGENRPQRRMPGFIKVMLASSFRVEKFC